jgi:TRAP-type C4-dicarboxylate transport system substrate-binding protein
MLRSLLSSFSPFLATARRVLAVCFLAIILLTNSNVHASDQTSLRIVGGLDKINQYIVFEEPFWRSEISKRSGGAITASIHPFDRSGLRGQDMLQLIRLGVVPFGTALLSVVGGDEPELSAMDLPGLNPDLATLRGVVARYRPVVERILNERYDMELLGVYTYPAQVVFCAKPFASLADLRGRRIRTSSVAQSEMVVGLGGIPIVTPFIELVGSFRNGVVDCAITGTLSGHQIGLPKVSTHVHEMAVSWGLSVFGANKAAWNALRPNVRQLIREGVADLERDIWNAADADTALGLDCSTGLALCPGSEMGRMVRVQLTPEDKAKSQELLREVVLPRWIERCGAPCVTGWNDTLSSFVGLSVTENGVVTVVPRQAGEPSPDLRNAQAN